MAVNAIVKATTSLRLLAITPVLEAQTIIAKQRAFGAEWATKEFEAQYLGQGLPPATTQKQRRASR